MQETLAFPSDPYDLKVLKSFAVLCLCEVFFLRDLELLAFSDSSIQSKMQYHKWHEAEINISVAALKANSDNFGFYVQDFSHIKEPLNGIVILAVSPCFVW